MNSSFSHDKSEDHFREIEGDNTTLDNKIVETSTASSAVRRDLGLGTSIKHRAGRSGETWLEHDTPHNPMIYWFRFNKFLVFFIKIVPQNHVTISQKFIKRFDNNFLRTFIFVVPGALLLENFDSERPVARQELLLVTADR